MERIENQVKEERPPIGKITVKGPVDVVFRRSDKPMRIAASETADHRVSGPSKITFR